MATEKKTLVYSVEFDADGAVKSMSKLDKQVDDLGDSIEKSEKNTKGLGAAFKGVGTAMKAAGIGLIVAALAKLAEGLSENQKFADGFSKVFITIGAVANELIATLEPLVEVVKGLIDLDFDRVSNGFSQLGKNVKEFGANIGETVSKASELADEIVRLRNEVILAEAEEERLSLLNRKRAEELRQVRDDESKSIQERLEASKGLEKLLDQQEAVRIKNARTRVKLAELELSKNKENVELQAEVIRAKNAILAIEEETAGFRSEQQSQERALLREAREEEALAMEAFAANEVDLVEQTEKKKLAIKKSYAQEQVKIATDSSKTKRKIDEKDVQAGLAIAESAAGALEALAGDNAVLAKAASYAQAVINVAQGITAAIAQGGVAGIATGAAVAAAGAIQIAKIASTPIPGEGSGGGSATSGVSAPSVSYAAPQFNIAGDDGTNQLGQAINNQTQTPVKAYVTTKDFNSTQALERNINNSSRIGG